MTLTILLGSSESFAAITGSGTSASPYIISSADDWNSMSKSATELAKYVKSTVYIELGADIDFDGVAFYPLGGFYYRNIGKSAYFNSANAYVFQGHFDGKGYKISNINTFLTGSNCQNSYYGIFGNVKNATIQNLVVDGIKATSDAIGIYNIFGGVAGNVLDGVTISNCVVINSDLMIKGNGSIMGVGGICGVISGSDVSIKDCAVYNSTTYYESGQFCGGLAGQCTSIAISIENCYTDVRTTNSIEECGGFLGKAVCSTGGTIKNCFAAGSITSVDGGNAHQNLGGFVGEAQNVSFTNCGSFVSILSNNSVSTTADHQHGGFCGTSISGNKFSNCFGAGPITYKTVVSSDYSAVNYFTGNKDLDKDIASPASYTNCYAQSDMFAAATNEGKFPTPISGSVYVYPDMDNLDASVLKAKDYVQSEDMASLLNTNAGAFTWTFCPSLNYSYPFPASSAYLHLLRVLDKITVDDSTKISRQFACPATADPCDPLPEKKKIEDFCGGSYTYAGENIVATSAIVEKTYNETIAGENGDCDTALTHIIRVHPAVVVNSIAGPTVCNTYTYTKRDGSTINVTYGDESSYTITDVLKSKLCDCDSIIDNVTFSKVGRSYTKDNTAEADLVTVNLYGCSSSDLVYNRDLTNDTWNLANQLNFTYSINGATFSEVDELKTRLGCDSVVLISGKFDTPHSKDSVVHVCANELPYSLNGTECTANPDGVTVNKYNVTIVRPSKTGGCDTTVNVVVYVHPVKVSDETKKICSGETVTLLDGTNRVLTEDYDDALNIKSRNCDCDSINSTVHYLVGTPYNITQTYSGCTEVEFEGVSYTESKKITKNLTSVFGCDSIVNINIVVSGEPLENKKTYSLDFKTVAGTETIPVDASAGTSITVSYSAAGLNVTGVDGSTYSVSRGEEVINDELVYSYVLKNKAATCDSVKFSILATLKTTEKEKVEVSDKCWAIPYVRQDGQTVYIDSVSFERFEIEGYDGGTRTSVYRDTLFDSPDSTTGNIIVYKLTHYMTFKEIDNTYYEAEGSCGSITFDDCNGKSVTFSGDEYTETKYYYCTYTQSGQTCPTSVTRYQIKLKGMSSAGVEINIGSLTEEPANLDPADETNLNGRACDVVRFQGSDGKTRTVRRTGMVTTYRISDDDCKTDIYNVAVNASVSTDTTLHGCSIVYYTSKSGVIKTFTASTTYKDVLDYAVPVCRCDSIWNVNVVVHNTNVITAEPVSACNSYVYHYLDPSKADLTVTNDTVISDTIKSKCSYCVEHESVCDSIIRITTITIHKPNQVETVQTVIPSCGSYSWFDSDTRREITVYSDTLLFDTIPDENGCDSLVVTEISVLHGENKDSLIIVPGSYFLSNEKYSIYTAYDNRTHSWTSPQRVTFYTVEDIVKLEGHDCADTIKYTIRIHPKPVDKTVLLPAVCDRYDYTKQNGEVVRIEYGVNEAPFVILDTIKSLVQSDIDSVYLTVRANKIGRTYLKDDSDSWGMNSVSLYGCSSSPLVYQRDNSASEWNRDTTISVSSGSSVVYRNKFTVYDTLKTFIGCDSLVQINGEFDVPHTQYTAVPKVIHVCYTGEPYTAIVKNGDEYSQISVEPSSNGSTVFRELRNVILPSTTGGCDTIAGIIHLYMHGIKNDTLDIGRVICDSSMVSVGLDYVMVSKDTIIYRTIKSEICDCDSIYRVYPFKVGHNTPTSQISAVNLVGCDVVNFVDKPTSYNIDYSFTRAFDIAATYPQMKQIPYRNIDGCDSVVPVYYTIGRTAYQDIYQEECGVYSFFNHNHELVRFELPDGLARDTFYYNDTLAGATASGCDSIVRYTVYLGQFNKQTQRYSGCGVVSAKVAQDSYEDWNLVPVRKYEAVNEVYDTSFVVPNVESCGTIYTVKVHVDPVYHYSHDIVGCGSVSLNGVTYNESTIVVERNRSVAGCDSIDTFHVVVKPVELRDSTINVCGSVLFNGRIFRKSQTIVDTIKYTDGCGCDSVIVTTGVTIRNHPSLKVIIDSCRSLTFNEMKGDSYCFAINDSIFEMTDDLHKYTRSTYFNVFGEPGENGCDSIITYELNVGDCFPYPIIVNKYNWVLALNKDFVGDDVTGYQWYKTEDGVDKIIRNANYSYYTENKTLEGCYKVTVSYGDTLTLDSETLCINQDSTVSLKYDLYPDPVPVNEPVFLTCNFDCTDAVVEVYNAVGVKVYTTKAKSETIEIPASAHRLPGYYFVKMITADNVVLSVKFLVTSK